MREILLLLLFGQNAAQQGKCASCVGRMDHTGAIQGNAACFEDLEENDDRVDWRKCPILIGLDPVCESTAITHWTPDGKQTLTVVRSCAEIPTGTEDHNDSFCLDEVISSQTGEYWRSCTSYCDAREEFMYECNRNTMLSTIALHDSGKGDLSCQTCSGENCESGGVSENCPIWANHACFSATQFEINKEDADPEKTSVNRGCSSFSSVDKCNEIEENSDICRQTCSESNCNKNDLRPLSRCHVCEAILDPFSDHPNNCFNSTDENIVTCAFEEQFCATKLTAEWTKRGNQIHRLVRGCSEHASPEEITEETNCVGSSVNNEKTKDCRVSCESYGCNSDNDIFDLFNAGTVSSCMTCNNTDECLDGLSGFSECPEYATAGCYVGTNWKEEADFEIYRHCSSFEEPRNEECDLGFLDASRHTICKSSCSDNDCNDASVEYPAPASQCLKSEFHFENLNEGMKSSVFFAFLAGSTGVKADGEAHVCAACFVLRDHTGKKLFGDEDCDNDDAIEQRWKDFQSGADGNEQNVTLSPHFINCPAADFANFTSSCETTVFVQWEANGRENFQINRGCYYHPVGIPDDDCTVWTNNERFHSCYKLCRGDEIPGIEDASVACNALPDYGLKEVEKLHFADSGGKEQKCHTCSAEYGSDQAEIDACKTLSDKNASPDVCPGWASRGCFEVEEITLRPDINQTKPDIGYHKGCSAFDTFNDDADEQGIICQEFRGAFFEWGEACKTTCKDGDYCNEDLLEELPTKCYTCEYTWSDHGGIQGDPACAFHDLLGPIQLQNCPADKNNCVVEMTAKMVETGEQQHTIKRYCGDEAPQEETPETNCETSISSDFSNLWAIKKCKTSCDDQIACNYHDNVFKLFETGNINRCYICADEQEGEEIGGGFCRFFQQSRCPNFADAGCYTSANWLSDWPGHENTKAQFYHGCSSFTADEIRQECHRKIVGGELDTQAFDLTICREVCDGFSDCNFTPIKPPVAPKCAACVATKDHLGNILAGNPKCFENLEADDEDILWVSCPETDGSPFKPVCESSSYVQWEPNGRQTLTVTQGCFEVLREENNDLDVCNFETVSGAFQARNCIKTCDPTGRGDECNRKNIEHVIAKQGIENSDIACRSCSANSTSSPEQIEYCRNVPSPIDPTGCPSWANRACFNVRDAVIKPDGDASPGDSDIAYHKGCSSFDFTEEDNENVETSESVNCREYYDINAHRYTESCKETSKDKFCNEGEVKQPMKCFSCNYAWDDFGIAVGSGDPRCKDPKSFAPSDLTTCPEDKPYCFTEFEADWNQRGNQFHRVARGCTSHKSVEPPTKADNCETYLSDTNGQWSQKTCAVSCDSAVLGCNDNNDIYDLFSTGKVSRCHSCHLSQRPGENIGVEDCDTNTHVGDSKTCEKYEDNGCYTAKNWHVEYGTELMEAYRGCSSFTQDEVDAPSCEDFVLGGAGGGSSSVYTTCREWCDNDRCNDQGTAHLIFLHLKILEHF